MVWKTVCLLSPDGSSVTAWSRAWISNGTITYKSAVVRRFCFCFAKWSLIFFASWHLVEIFLVSFCETDNRVCNQSRSLGKWLFLCICPLTPNPWTFQFLGDAWIGAALKQQSGRWMSMPLKAQGSFRCKDQAAMHDNSMGEHRKMMSLVIRKVNTEQIFTVSCNTRSARCPRKWSIRMKTSKRK